MQTSVFQWKLKQTEVVALHKKLDPLNKENYRPASNPSLHLSKVFEGIIYKKINIYMEDKLTKCLTGFRKLHDTCLLTMPGNWKRGIDNGVCASDLFMNLSKVFYTINHDLLLAKLKEYGFSTNALNRKFKLITNLL